MVDDTVRRTRGLRLHKLRSTCGVETFESGYFSTAGNVFPHTFSQPGTARYQYDPHEDTTYGTVTVASTPELEPSSVDLSGNIETVLAGHGAVIRPVCAIVLASGEFMFSCDPIGQFSLQNLPREVDGTVVRQIYAHGFAPAVRNFNEFDTPLNVRVARFSECERASAPRTRSCSTSHSGPVGVVSRCTLHHPILIQYVQDAFDGRLTPTVAYSTLLPRCSQNPQSMIGHYKRRNI